MLPRSLMVPPGDPEYMTRERRLPAGPCAIAGRAWSGQGAITGVDFSADGGQTWRDAALERDVDSDWAWQRWTIDWDCDAGRVRALLPRARRRRERAAAGARLEPRRLREQRRPARPRHRRLNGVRAFFGRTLRAVKLVLLDGDIPRPIRWGGAVGVAPIPGPFDEAVLLLVACDPLALLPRPAPRRVAPRGTASPSPRARRNVERVVVVGSSGSGKTTVARALAERLDVHYVELDALHHKPNWTEASADELREAVHRELDGRERWVVDGNYYGKLGDFVLDAGGHGRLARPAASHVPCRGCGRRTMHRIRDDVELWNGNRETWRGAFWGRESLFWWTVRHHSSRRRRWPRRFAALPNLTVVRLRTPAEVEAFLVIPAASQRQTDSPRL